jgi:hypothetical protein
MKEVTPNLFRYQFFEILQFSETRQLGERVFYWAVFLQDIKSRFVTICDKIGISHVHVFCAKSVGVTNYYSSLFTIGFTAAEVTIGELAKGKGLLVMRSWV